MEAMLTRASYLQNFNQNSGHNWKETLVTKRLMNIHSVEFYFEENTKICML